MAEEESGPKNLFVRAVNQMLDPDNIKSMLMLLGVLAVAAVLFGIFNGGGSFLLLLKDSEVSRGLITFLVALTTVLLAIILTLYAITAEDKEAIKDRFSLAKEVLTILVGILGTVLGFYFGSAEKTASGQLALADINYRGGQVMTHVAGGTPPYRYSITAPNQPFSKIEARLSTDGWIVETLDKQPTAGTPINITVSDAKDKTASKAANYPAEPAVDKPSQGGAASASSPHSTPQTTNRP